MVFGCVYFLFLYNEEFLIPIDRQNDTYENEFLCFHFAILVVVKIVYKPTSSLIAKKTKCMHLSNFLYFSKLASFYITGLY